MNDNKPKIILFGTGNGGKNGYKHLKKQFRIIGFCDNDTQKHGQRFMGIPIHAPADLETLDYDRIVICSMYHDAIQSQLVSDIGIPPEKIDILDADIRVYGSGGYRGCLIAGVAALLALGYGIYRLIAWIIA